MTVVERKYPRCRITYHSSLHDGFLAVKYGKIDAFAFDRHTLQYVLLRNPDLALMDEKIADEQIVVGTAPGREALMAQINRFIKQYRADGTYRDMYNRWILGENPTMPDLPEPRHPSLHLNIGTDGVNEPMSFFKDGRLTGFDIEFARRLALFLNAGITLHTVEFPAIITAAATGKIDLIVAGLNVTPERRGTLLFSDTYIDSEIAFLVRRDRLGAGTGGRITGIEGLAGEKVGVQTGTTYETVLKQKIPEAIPVYFTTFTDQIEAVRTGKIAGFLTDEVVAQDMIRRTPGITYLPEWLRANEYAFAISRDRPELQWQVNAVLRKMKQDGTLERLAEKWFGPDDALKVLPPFKTNGPKGAIRFATNSNSAPFVYMKDGRLVGYDVETAMIVAEAIGYGLQVMDMDFAAIIPSLASGKADMAGDFIAVTEERAKSVLFSLPIYTGGTVAVVASGTEGGSIGVLRGLQSSFFRTFVDEDRYKMVFRGLGVTFLITVASALMGTLLGFGVCMMRRSGSRWANIPAKVFIRSIQGTPIIVLLMILYYVVFGRVDVSGVLVAILGFSINFAAYVSEMMRTGIEAVDKGQHEAACALGFNRLQVFAKITLPQAARHVLPVFRGEFISMLKMTSVVGYIAIQDLTKVSDIIRSRTYEAFFPLIATALMYFVIAYAMAWMLSLVEARIDPKRRKRAVKGVVTP